MEINRNNYEIYVLDYIEGNLSAEIRADFDYFLSKNPDLKAEISEFEHIGLEPVDVSFSSKENLRKESENEIFGLTRFERLCISKLEGDIEANERVELNKMLSESQEKQIEFEYFAKTKFSPNKLIRYKNKLQLKHFSFFEYKFIAGSIAAAIILVIGFALFFNTSVKPSYGKELSSYPKSINEYLVTPKMEFAENRKTELYKKIEIQPEIEQPLRDTNRVFMLNSKNLVSLENAKTKGNFNIEEITDYSVVNNNHDQGYVSLTQFVNRQFKEKLLKQPADEKVTIVSLGRALGRGIGRILHKEIKLDEKTLDDGSKLYAFKAGNFEIYTNVKPSKKADQTGDEKQR